jgi:hypothetical protein
MNIISYFIHKLSTSRIPILLLGLACFAHCETEVSQNGITWKFRENYEVGQFVNGDYYVIAPPEGVVVESVSPDRIKGRHGVMVNPGLDSHAWDDRISGYDERLEVQFPLVLRPGQSLVKVISILDEEWVNGIYNTQWQGTATDRYKIKTAGVLTCLDKRPPDDSFRPPYIGSNKPIYRYGSMNRKWFPNLATPSTVPVKEIATLERGLERMWILTPHAHSARAAHPVENQPGYHREVGSFISRASLILCTKASTPKLEIGFIQTGLDYYGMGSQPSGTGDSSFWKWPVIFTGLLLGESEIYHLFSNGNYSGVPRDAEKFYYIKDGTSSHSSNVIEGNSERPFNKTWTGSRVGFRKGIGNQEHEHLHPSEWDVVASGGGAKQESYRWCCDSHPTVGQILAAMIISRNSDRPSILAGVGPSRFATSPIKCFYPAGSSFDGGDTEEFSAFDYTFRFMMEPFADRFHETVRQYYPNSTASSPSNSYIHEMWIRLGDGFMSNSGEFTIDPETIIVNGKLISPPKPPEKFRIKGLSK